MNELWMRVGMTFRFTEEEIDAILNQNDGGAEHEDSNQKGFR